MLIADTHVHFYPAHDATVALDCAYRNLSLAGGGTAATDVALLLTERFDCFFFRDLVSGRISLPAGFTWTPGAENGSLLLSRDRESRRLWLFAGRQVVTADGIEVLALLTTGHYPDRQDTRETIARIRADGGIPVLSWSPGKWLGRRGHIIRALIEQAGDDLLALGDTAMRPRCAPVPALIRLGRERGLPVLAGSDPLPFAGDEVSTGRYAVRIDTFDERAPVTSLRSALSRGGLPVVGQRDVLPRMLVRWIRNQRVRKAAS